MLPGTKPRVAVIGGGPGGARCAERLSDAGFPVTLFEPRVRYEKACGGGIPERGLRRFPFLSDARLPGKSIHECLLISPSGRETRVPLFAPLYVFSRADLHAFMLDRAAGAGAEIVRGRVLSFRSAEAERAGGVSGRAAWILRVAGADGRESEAGPFGFLVAADGAAGSARRRLLPGERDREVSQGIGYYLPGASEDFITLKFYEGLHGYLWVFPRPGHSSAGICATLGALPAAALKKRLDDFLAARYPRAVLNRSERYAALIPAAPREPRQAPIQGDGWAVVGDAARSVDPLTREGIYYAMLSGDLLADALATGRPGQYTEAWARNGAAELSWAASHGGLFFDRRFIERLVRWCGSSPALARVLSDLIAGRQEYRTLKRRLLLTAPLAAYQLARRAAAIRLRRARGSRSTGR